MSELRVLNLKVFGEYAGKIRNASMVSGSYTLTLLREVLNSNAEELMSARPDCVDILDGDRRLYRLDVNCVGRNYKVVKVWEDCPHDGLIHADCGLESYEAIGNPLYKKQLWELSDEEHIALVKRQMDWRTGKGDDGYAKPVIVSAANRYNSDGRILVGARHWDSLMGQQSDDLGRKGSEPHIQGFIDQARRFYTREAALRIVLESGQYFDCKRNGSDNELFSEGLY